MQRSDDAVLAAIERDALQPDVISAAIDRALQQATSGMVRWLDRDYGLNANEAAMVLGFAVKYDVVDLVGTQVSVAARVFVWNIIP